MARGKGGITKYIVWAILIASFVGFGAFGTVNFSGGVGEIGRVGDTEITTAEYTRALQSEMRSMEAQTGQPMTVEQARQQGVTNRVLSQVVTNAALEDETKRMGLSVGDERVAEALRNIDAFSGSDGSFDRDAYAYALRNAGLNEGEFEENLRRDSARSILQGAVLSGVSLPDTYVDTLLSYVGETRAFTWATLGRDALNTGLPVADEDTLRAFYEDNIEQFTLPETKAITYAWITPEMIVDTVEIDEDTLRAAYEERHDEFNMPERRLVERLVFSDESEAQAAMDRISSGDADFETIVEDRGLVLADTDMGDVTRASLNEAGEPVFSAEVGDVVGPAPSPLGPALYRVNGVLAAQETSFEDAVPDLRDALVFDRARRVIEGMAQDIDDELAGGATLEELASDTEMELGQIDWTAESDSGIAGYETFREAAQAVTRDDYPAIETLGDGGIFALRLDELREPAPAPFEDVRDRVETLWEQEQAQEALVAQAQDLVPALSGDGSFEESGLDPVEETGLTRNAQIDGLPRAVLEAAFDMDPAEVRVVPGAGEALVVRLDTITPVNADEPQVAQLGNLLRDRAANSVSQDLFNALNADIQSRAGVTIDQSAINAVLSNFR
ncbi:MAG: peptidylprolyl isomerase [Rhodobacteraceae bacterium]|jgi:peptidyl-prolyl cis-trans isomerase D|uniref:Peptidyl-prolyl cis-trans isomerase D n=1 Tax=Salipiger profundus TaxID=1229727 RepID=A0A1U7D9J0_9RHOB|nr:MULTISPECIES: SurA N-terminal domain-containing protein [Salipiger]APX24847.1 peptidyl-prolyl cis-trans isomerase D [Salipiger profundus]MAB07763.1 peptidylprolyl isomerase [Paracoccaceae bacterium]SFC97360.1 peptidyl-prolyl cis-trans isomerase D [Salipiger profundus]